MAIGNDLQAGIIRQPMPESLGPPKKAALRRNQARPIEHRLGTRLGFPNLQCEIRMRHHRRSAIASGRSMPQDGLSTRLCLPPNEMTGAIGHCHVTVEMPMERATPHGLTRSGSRLCTAVGAAIHLLVAAAGWAAYVATSPGNGSGAKTAVAVLLGILADMLCFRIVIYGLMRRWGVEYEVYRGGWTGTITGNTVSISQSVSSNYGMETSRQFLRSYLAMALIATVPGFLTTAPWRIDPPRAVLNAVFIGALWPVTLPLRLSVTLNQAELFRPGDTLRAVGMVMVYPDLFTADGRPDLAAWNRAHFVNAGTLFCVEQTNIPYPYTTVQKVMMLDPNGGRTEVYTIWTDNHREHDVVVVPGGSACGG